VAANESGTPIGDGLCRSSSKVLHGVNMRGQERTIGDLSNEVLNAATWPVAWESEQADNQIELAADDDGLELTIGVSPKVATHPQAGNDLIPWRLRTRSITISLPCALHLTSSRRAQRTRNAPEFRPGSGVVADASFSRRLMPPCPLRARQEVAER